MGRGNPFELVDLGWSPTRLDVPDIPFSNGLVNGHDLVFHHDPNS